VGRGKIFFQGVSANSKSRKKKRGDKLLKDSKSEKAKNLSEKLKKAIEKREDERKILTFKVCKTNQKKEEQNWAMVLGSPNQRLPLPKRNKDARLEKGSIRVIQRRKLVAGAWRGGGQIIHHENRRKEREPKSEIIES